jgi:hypothetical protein
MKRPCTSPKPSIFKWRHFEPAIILCAVRWDLRYSLSYRDVRELLVEQESARKSGVCCAAYLRE